MATGPQCLTLLWVPACLLHRTEASASSPAHAKGEAGPGWLLCLPKPHPSPFSMSPTRQGHHVPDFGTGVWQEEFEGEKAVTLIVLGQRQRRKSNREVSSGLQSPHVTKASTCLPARKIGLVTALSPNGHTL